MLIAFTLVSVGATALLGVVDAVLLALVVAGIATYALQHGRLAVPPAARGRGAGERRGRVSGIGVAVGFLGILTALFAIGGSSTTARRRRRSSRAGLLLLFALPCFFLVRERDRSPASGAGAARSPSWRRRCAVPGARRTGACCSPASSTWTPSPP